MRKHLNHVLLIVLTAAALAGCGKKDGEAHSEAVAGGVPAPAVATAPSDAPKWKQTEKFGTVSNIALTPLYQAPAKYSNYIHQEASEVTKEEYRALPDAAFERYVATWVQQASSLDKPDWALVAGILRPEITAETNEFKKQEAADKAKADITPDKNALNVVYGWQGEILNIAGPDVSNGEYYLLLRPEGRSWMVSYLNKSNQRHSLYYHPDFSGVGMQGDNRGDMQLTVKVPIEKAKEIETLREQGNTMVRVYGRVKAVYQTPVARRDGTEAALQVEVQALEIGSRQNGVFKPFFFLDADQLKKSKA
jgi:hypothetical protein